MSDDAAALRQALAEERAKSANLTGALQQEQHGRFFAEERSVENAIIAAQNEANALEGDAATATMEGRFTEAAKAQRKLAETAARLTQLEQRKEWFTSQREAVRQQPQGAADPFEQFVNAYPENVRSWIRQNPRFFNDSTYRSYVTGAANVALGKGLKPGTPEYFNFVEERTAQDMNDDPDGIPVEQPTRRTSTRAQTAEPRTAPRAQSATNRLSADEVEMAETLAKSLEPVGDDGKPLTSKADILLWYHRNKTGERAKGLRTRMGLD